MKEGKRAPENQINVLCGFHSVEAALGDPRSLGELLHDATRRDPRLSRLLGLAKSKGVTLHRATRAELDALSGGIRHQGLIGLLNRAPAGKLPALKLWLESQSGCPLVLILDGIQDPRNVGACLRTAAAAGAEAVVFPQRVGAGLTPAALRVASGGVHKLKIFEVSSWSRAFEYMKSAGLWVVGTAEDGDQDLYDFDLVRPLALVVGSEATGLRPVTRKFCDAVLRIPSAHALSSLNVAVAAGVALFEVRRQRGQQAQ